MPDQGKKQSKKRRVRWGLIWFLIILILLAAAALSAVFWYSINLKPTGTLDQEETVEVKEGETYAQLLDDLKAQDLIRSDTAASIYIKLNSDHALYPGNYRISKGMTTPEILTYLSNPDNKELSYAVVTIPEGYWAKQVAEVLSSHFPEYTADEFLKLWNSDDYINQLAQDYDFINTETIENNAFFVKLEGYLFPDTYFIDYDMTPDQITRVFLDQFQIVYDKYRTQIEESGYTLEQILTLASIVQFESGDAAEMPDIAQVFYNRLEQGMMLQSSVTVCYALYDEFESASDCEVNTQVDSPYNTYLHDGLPIGPINNPGEEAIAAVLNPHDNDYLYFVSDIYGDGSIYYARTLEEHEANIDKFGLRIQ